MRCFWPDLAGAFMAGSRYLSHVKWWFVILPMLALVIEPLLPDQSWLLISNAEQNSVFDVLGADRARGSVVDTNAAFRSAFVDTGMVAASLRYGGARIPDGGMAAWGRRWVRNFWRLTYRMLYRLIVMRHWLVGSLILYVGAGVDGAIRRRIRASTFGTTSPLIFHLASHAVVLLIGGLLCLLVAPITISAYLWWPVTLLMAMLVWRSVSSFQVIA
ncbi:DUF4400 domain-containing protein [Robbsia andropogonis]|uniref:DUF4400 domain-containing protein n=2 Tax=Robbsia andropogonis TaxID=28092 RepID=UPI00209E40D5|nr:DUF4400 domain-containing protein [Robbsia andropogonis]MCP1121508.1 DUF4400 domain-containing protein [Robbsia andropogonis]MCP1131328.1 DUF4400 domain-containing protein [Robbsia andropogonis]